MTPQHFKASLTQSGANVFVVLPFDPNQVWGAKQRHHITGSVNGCTVRGALVPNADHYVLPLGLAWRRDNGLKSGQEVDVVLIPEGPQGERLSPDVAAALDAAPLANSFFEALATFYRKNYIRWIESARRPETRAARIVEMVGLLNAGKKQRD